MWPEFHLKLMSRTKTWFAISGTIIAIGIAAVLIKGLFFGIDFKGGTAMDVVFTKPVTVAKVRAALATKGFGDSIVQLVSAKEALIRSRQLTPGEVSGVQAALQQQVGVAEYKSIQTVGPGWGEVITQRALMAFIVSIFGVLAYISLRFEFKMAVAAILALVHDALITVGIYALVGREITPYTIAALLTILGYSLYDTIVVFDRVRENSATLVKMTYSTMVDNSINQVLGRSINTTVITLLPVAALLVLGGETLRDFAFALLIGMTTGAYSSIFVASPILNLWKESEPRYKALKARHGDGEA